MTVALGLVCADGVIVASDSNSIMGNVSRQAVKVHALKNAPAVWTASGSVYVIEEVEEAISKLEAQIPDDPATNQIKRALVEGEKALIRSQVGGAIHKAVKDCYDLALPHGAGTGAAPGHHVFGSDFLVLGWTTGTPYFLEFAQDAQMNWHTAAGFFAVGSGGEFALVANALMAHYVEGDPLAVEDGLLLAWRTIDTTSTVSSHFLGGPVQIAVADENGARVLDDAEIEEVKTAVAGWKAIERDSIRRRKSPDAPEPEALPAVEPDTPNEATSSTTS